MTLEGWSLDPSGYETHGEVEVRHEALGALSQICQRASVGEYEATLDLLVEVAAAYGTNNIEPEQGFPYKSLLDPVLSLEKIHCRARALLQTLSILLCNSPDGTLLISQKCLERVLSIIKPWVTAKRFASSHSLNCKDYEGTALTILKLVETLMNAKVRGG
jgi:hypothetical protein